jgi:hypothetical protein
MKVTLSLNEVSSAATELLSEGQKVHTRSIRALLRHGSFNTIHRHLVTLGYAPGFSSNVAAEAIHDLELRIQILENAIATADDRQNHFANEIAQIKEEAQRFPHHVLKTPETLSLPLPTLLAEIRSSAVAGQTKLQGDRV